MSKIKVAALYKFVTIDDYKELKPKLLKFCNNHNIKGTLLLAREGINGTISGTIENISTFLNYLKLDPRFSDLEYKSSYFDKHPFYRMKIKLKKEIVTIGVPTNPVNIVGKYVDPKEWNELITDPEVLVIDTRNKYETDIGTFKNAIIPNTDTFREFPEYAEKTLETHKNKRIAMFCTGGIRCEKSTSFLLSQGHKEVYHLKGGILKYLEETPKEESLWEGECFVFDNRVSLNNKLDSGNYDQCFGCRSPITDKDKQSNKYLKGIHCPKCYSTISEDKYQRSKERQLQISLAKKRNEQHMGKTFAKS